MCIFSCSWLLDKGFNHFIKFAHKEQTVAEENILELIKNYKTVYSIGYRSLHDRSALEISILKFPDISSFL